ncbi:hypothetical protein CCACVL1_17556 [Corchorus capsularis]|uniref:Uncharacterized protein n=1 Tax=Corchorus capsularis TaxID=210143 RepID=A0A1R3HR80_COCAP|nr:hypothetical protein CCACVL1_17556 [Corchorus capsularis]
MGFVHLIWLTARGAAKSKLSDAAAANRVQEVK